MTMQFRKLRNKIIICITAAAIILVFVFFAFNLYILLSTPEKYMVTADNYIDYQLHYECSGYSVAYVLRSMGENADGMTLYKNIPYKNTDGTVLPHDLVKFLKESGYEAKLCSGTLMQIKNSLNKGIPIIAFVKTAPQETYYHYLPIAGYDEDNFYAADSLRAYTNADEEHYNRILSAKDFEAMLETEIYKRNTYIVLEQN